MTTVLRAPLSASIRTLALRAALRIVVILALAGCSDSTARNPGSSPGLAPGGSGASTSSGGQSSGAAGLGGAGELGGDGGLGASSGAGKPPGGAGGSANVGGAGSSSGGGGAGGDAATESPLIPFRLRAELLDAPLGIQTATPRLGWALESSDTLARGLSQLSYEVLVASSPERLQAGDGDLWNSGVVSSTHSSIVYAGQALRSFSRAYWKVRVMDQARRLSLWSMPSEFTVGLLTASDWGAQWITGGSAAPLPILRREFSVAKPLRRALASVCGLGQFELRVNGVNPSDAVMEPASTNFTKACQYSTYDVTSKLVQGANALGVLLGNGMYNVPASSRYAKFTGSYGPLRLILRLELEYADGTEEAVVTNESWRVRAGPVTFSNIYGGEDFDARAEPSGWDRPGFDDTAWSVAALVGGTAPSLVGRIAPPVKVMQELATARVTEPQSGVFVYDLGQNFAGWPELVLTGSAGAIVRLTPGEVLNASGNVSQQGSGSPTWFEYTLKGGGAETWHPRFTYTGFRYIQVSGAVPVTSAASFPSRPQISSLTGKFLHASNERVGSFSSSDQDLNRIHALILAAIRSNMQSLLTDCPHREKLGWQETSHLLAPGIMFNYDAAAFYEKIVRDAAEAQLASGLVPDIAPEHTVFSGNFRDSPEWGMAYVINPWHLYQTYGERRALDEHYANMKRYVSYIGAKASQNVLSYGLGDWYDVGPNPPGTSQLTTAGVTATSVWLQGLKVLESAATLLGNSTDASQFRTSQTTITNAFNARFLSGSSYDRGSQTANAMPLALGLVPDAQRSSVLTSLIASITGAQNRVTAGDIGFAYVVRALSEAGRGDVIYALLKQASGPGYLYQINRGATSLTEAWDANPSSSQNHAMLGHAEAWFYSGLGGINPDPAGPGFERFVVRPQPQAGIDSVDVSYQSVRGLIVSKWQRTDGGITFSVTVPPNTTAAVHIPTNNPSAVTENGIAAANAPGVTSHEERTDALVLSVGSGSYVFEAP